MLLLLAASLLLAACSGSGSSAPASASPPTAQPVATPAQQTFTFTAPDPSAGLGDELASDPAMETYTGTLCDSWHYDGSVQGARSSAAHSGNFAQQLQLSTYNGTSSNASADLWTGAGVSPGQWYRAGFWAKRVAGSAGDVFPWLYAPGGGVSYLSRPITGDAYAYYVCTAQASTNSLMFGVNNGPRRAPSDTVVIDDVSIRAIPFASMVSLQDVGSRFCKAVAAITLQPGTQAGVVFGADSATNPRNFLLAYHDGFRIHFDKVIGGVHTPVPAAVDLPNYTAAGNPDVTYQPGAALEIQRAPGSDLYAVYYRGRLVGQQTVSDPALTANTALGPFNSFEGNQVAFNYFPASVSKKVVFLGGSITNGAGTTLQKNGWQWLLRDYLDTTRTDVSWSFVNAAAGGTDSWYSLVRLQSDVLAYAPDVVFVDEAVNDGELDSANPAWPYLGEAIIRRIRTALPNCKIVVCNFMRPVGSDGSSQAGTEAVRAAWNTIASHYRCDLYRMDTALLAALPANPSTALIDAYFSSPGNVHPNDKGHALIFSGLSASLDLTAANPWTGNLADYPRLSAATRDYEAASTIVSGAGLLANAGSTGTWTSANADCTAVGIPSACCTGVGSGSCTGVSSAVPGSTLSFTGSMVMAGLDVELQNGAWPAGLQYSLDGGAWTAVAPQNPSVWDAEFLFIPTLRAVHTLAIRLNAGKVTINRLLAI
jgi:lysophospholipase L1-like esterase